MCSDKPQLIGFWLNNINIGGGHWCACREKTGKKEPTGIIISKSKSEVEACFCLNNGNESTLTCVVPHVLEVHATASCIPIYIYIYTLQLEVYICSSPNIFLIPQSLLLFLFYFLNISCLGKWSQETNHSTPVDLLSRKR